MPSPRGAGAARPAPPGGRAGRAWSLVPPEDEGDREGVRECEVEGEGRRRRQKEGRAGKGGGGDRGREWQVFRGMFVSPPLFLPPVYTFTRF